MTKNLEVLRSKKLFVLDMDGTFYLGERLIEGSLEFLEKLSVTGQDFLFFTNNSSKISAVYKDRLARMGCYVEENKVVTSGDVTIKYLKEEYPHGRRISGRYEAAGRKLQGRRHPVDGGLSRHCCVWL